MHDVIMSTTILKKKTKSRIGKLKSSSPKNVKSPIKKIKIAKPPNIKIAHSSLKTSLKKIHAKVIRKKQCQLICNDTNYEGKCGVKPKTYTQNERPFCYLASAFMIVYRTPLIHLVIDRSLSCSDYSLPILKFLRRLQCNNFNLPKNLGCTYDCAEPKDLPSVFKIFYEKEVGETFAQRKSEEQYEYGFPLQVLRALLNACKIPFFAVHSYSKYNPRPVTIVRTKYEAGQTISYQKFLRNVDSFVTHDDYSNHYYIGTIMHIEEPKEKGRSASEHAVSVIRCSEDEHKKLLLCDSNYRKCMNILKLSYEQKNYYFDKVCQTDDVFVLKSALP